MGQLVPFQALSLSCRLHSCCEQHATFSSHCSTTETYLTLFWPDFLFVYVASWGNDLEQLAYHQQALTQILRSVWQRGRGEKTLQGIISDRWSRAFHTSAPSVSQPQLLKDSNVELWLLRIQILQQNSLWTWWCLDESWEKETPAIPGLGFPISPTNWCKASPFQGSEATQRCPGPLKWAARVRVSEIKCKKRSKRK